MQRHAAMLVAAALVTGCGASPTRDQVQSPVGLPKFIAFLDEAATTRSTVEARLGKPVSSFEGGLVVSYRLGRVSEPLPAQWYSTQPDYDIKWASVPGAPGSIQLMIEYDDHGKVVRHALAH